MNEKGFVDLGHLIPQQSYPELHLESFEVDLLISILKAQSPAMEAYHRVLEGDGEAGDESKYQGSSEYRLYYELTHNGHCLKRDSEIQTAYLHLMVCTSEGSTWYEENRKEIDSIQNKIFNHWLKHSTSLHLGDLQQEVYVLNNEDDYPTQDFDDKEWIYD